MRVRMNHGAAWIVSLALVSGFARPACAQGSYPFQDSKLPDRERIDDLLSQIDAG